jgi:hypothetical protein
MDATTTKMKDPKHSSFRKHEKRIRKLLNGMKYEPKNSKLTPLIELTGLLGRCFKWVFNRRK